jgi:hypothetical protein
MKVALFVEALGNLQHSTWLIFKRRSHKLISMATVFAEIAQLAANRKGFNFLALVIFANFRLKCSVSYCLVSDFFYSRGKTGKRLGTTHDDIPISLFQRNVQNRTSWLAGCIRQSGV